MAKKNTTIEAGKRSKDWPEFMTRLSEVLDKLDEDQYLVINVKKSNRYVQFAGQGSYGLRAETASNHFLSKDERLDRKQVAETVYRFKGQAAPYIVFTEIDFETYDDMAIRKFFVGATRASMKLQLVMSERSASILMQRIAEDS
jgi:hypothetical protein